MTATSIADLLLTPQARDILRSAARASRHCERGGILVGYRTEMAIHVEDALTVSDRTAARTTYLRRSTPANRTLRDYMNVAEDPYIGYVGEWHTHPLPMPPSPTDRAAMRLMSMKNREPVALVVAARELDDRSVRFYGLASEPQPIAARMIGRHHVVTVRY
jgi:hypothetical protein